MGKVWREGLDLLAEGGERGLGNKVSRHLPTETQSKRSLCIPTLSWASMRVVGRKLEEDALLFGEGFWAQGLRVVNWGKSSSFYPRVLQGPVLDSPSWQTERGFSRAIYKNCIHILTSRAPIHRSLPWNCAWFDHPQPPYANTRARYWTCLTSLFFFLIWLCQVLIAACGI